MDAENDLVFRGGVGGRNGDLKRDATAGSWGFRGRRSDVRIFRGVFCGVLRGSFGCEPIIEKSFVRHLRGRRSGGRLGVGMSATLRRRRVRRAARGLGGHCAVLDRVGDSSRTSGTMVGDVRGGGGSGTGGTRRSSVRAGRGFGVGGMAFGSFRGICGRGGRIRGVAFGRLRGICRGGRRAGGRGCGSGG